jgi:uncharacterized damage-inducible protein DinB
MLAQAFLSYVDYNLEANQATLDAVLAISPENLEAAPSPSKGSLLRLLQHLVGVEAYFFAACQGFELQFPAAELVTPEALRDYTTKANRRVKDYLAQASETELAEVIPVPVRKSELRLPRWQFLSQAFLHSAGHRGELSILLSELGAPVRSRDAIVHFVEASGQAWPYAPGERG